jgi:hypothetical protein
MERDCSNERTVFELWSYVGGSKDKPRSALT